MGKLNFMEMVSDKKWASCANTELKRQLNEKLCCWQKVSQLINRILHICWAHEKKNQPFVDKFQHSVSIKKRNRTPLRFVTYITTVTTEMYPILT